MMHKTSLSSRVLFRFSLSYLALLIIPLCMGITAYFISLSTVREQTMVTVQRSLERAISEVECSFQEADNFASTLSQLNVVADLMDSPMDEDSRVLTLRSVIRSMPAFEDTYGLFQRYFLYIPKSDLIVDNKNAYIRLQDYYATTFRYGAQTLGEFRENVLTSYDALQLMPVMENNYQHTHFRSLLIGKIIVSPGRHIGRVIFYLDESRLIELLKKQCSDELCYLGLMANDGSLLMSSGEAITSQVFDALPSGQPSGYYSLRQDDLLIAYCQSNLLNATFALAIPNSLIIARVQNISTIMILGMGLMLLAGIGLAIALIKVNRKPLAAAMYHLPDSEINEQGPGLWPMVYAIRNMAVSHEQLAASINEQRRELQNAVLRLLVYGGAENEQEIESLLEHVGISLEGDWFCAVYLLLAERWEDTMNQQGDMQRTILLEELREWQPQLISIGLQTQSLYALLYVGNDGQALDRDLFGRLYQRLQSLGHRDVLISIGPRHRRLSNLYHSFLVAAQQLDCVDPGSWLLTAEKPKESYYYPAPLEQRLVNLAANGNFAGIEILLEQIRRDNFEKNRITGLMRDMLYHRMLDTLISTGSDVLLDGEEQWQLSRLSPTDFFATLKEKYRTLCIRSEEKKQQRSDVLLTQVQEYLQVCYTDYNTTLFSVAVHFGLTEKYFSSFFKEKTGINFSAYLEAMRIEKAEDLLHNSGLTIEKIAETVGYSCAKTFSRAFYRHKGCNPSQARKNRHMPRSEASPADNAISEKNN